MRQREVGEEKKEQEKKRNIEAAELVESDEDEDDAY